MAVIKAQRIPRKVESSEDIIAKFCYHYSQYTFAQARKLPYKRVKHLLNIALKEKAKEMYLMTQIVSAPHSKSGVRKVLKYLEDIMEEQI